MLYIHVHIPQGESECVTNRLGLVALVDIESAYSGTRYFTQALHWEGEEVCFYFVKEFS